MNSSESPVCLASALALARTDGAAAACARWPELAPHKSTLARVVVLEAVLQQAQQRVAEVAAEIDQLTQGLPGAGTGAGGLNCPAPFQPLQGGSAWSSLLAAETERLRMWSLRCQRQQAA